MITDSLAPARLMLTAMMAWALVATGTAMAQDDDQRTVTLAMRDVELSEVMEMLARAERVNILLANDVEATVSFSLYDVPLTEAIRSIAEAAGYAIERRNGTYFVVERDDVNSYTASDLTEVRSFRVQYADTASVESSLQPYLSDYGQITSIISRFRSGIEVIWP